MWTVPLCHCASPWNELTVYFVCSLPTLRVAGFYVCRFERVRGLLLNVCELHFTSFHVLYLLVVMFLLCTIAASHVEIHNQASSFICSYVIYMASVIYEWVRSFGGMIPSGENGCTWRKTCPSTTLSTNRKRTGLNSKTRETKRLGHSTATILSRSFERREIDCDGVPNFDSFGA
jgi:hypothetical protein